MLAKRQKANTTSRTADRRQGNGLFALCILILSQVLQVKRYSIELLRNLHCGKGKSRHCIFQNPQEYYQFFTSEN